MKRTAPKRKAAPKKKASLREKVLVYANLLIYTFFVYVFLSYELVPAKACLTPALRVFGLSMFTPVAWLIIIFCTIGLVLNTTKIISMVEREHPRAKYLAWAALVVLVILLVFLAFHYSIRCLVL